MAIIGIMLFYITCIIMTLIFSIKSFIFSTLLTILVNYFFKNDICSFLNIYSYKYYFVLYLIFIAFFTFFLGTFFNSKNFKKEPVDVIKLISVLIGWITTLYFGFNENLIGYFIGMNILNFSAVDFYGYVFNGNTKQSPVYAFFGITSLIHGILFSLLFVIIFIDQLTSKLIALMVVLTAYYIFKYFKMCIRSFI